MVDIKVNNLAIENIDLMIFDRDGTLIDLYFYWGNMVRKRAELIARALGLGPEHVAGLADVMGVDLKQQRIKPQGPVGIKKREIVMQAAIDYLGSIGINDSYALCVDTFKQVDSWSLSSFKDIIKPIAGLNELFDKLISWSCRIAIATTDKTERARLTLDYLSLTDKVDFVIGADGVKNSKPAPDMINLALESLKVKAENAVMVGDAGTDIEMGKNAGIKASIAVCSGISPREELSRLTRYVLDDISRIEVLKK